MDLTARPADTAIDDEMRHVNAFWTKFPCGALGEAAQCELPHGESRGMRKALDAGGRASQENGAVSAR
jgi:hypothetical protein